MNSFYFKIRKNRNVETIVNSLKEFLNKKISNLLELPEIIIKFAFKDEKDFKINEIEDIGSFFDHYMANL
jgi:hypothetical protein